MRISRREFATLAGATMVFGPASARAAAPNIFVPGFNLSANLEPQQAVSEGAPMRQPIELHVQQQLEQTIQAGQLFQSDLATLGINLKMVNDTFANMTSASAKPETTP